MTSWRRLQPRDDKSCSRKPNRECPILTIVSSSSFRGATLEHTGTFVFTWPLLTEVCQLIPAAMAPRVLEWVSLGGVSIAELSGSALELMASWMRQYSDLPIDLADASLLFLAHEHGLQRITTLDRRDFGIYQLPGVDQLENLLHP